MADRVLVAMSGGVDSSVAAALLAEAGHDVTGVTLKLWGGPSDSGCCSVSDVEDARRVAAQLDVPHYVFNLADDFTRDVVDPYVQAHADARTPNPCVDCNVHIKFGRLFERAAALGFDTVATGHHARVDHGPDGPHLRRGADAAKDQSYVLSVVPPEGLAGARFPVGTMTKAEVRAKAEALGLRTAGKPESMDVCFVTRGHREDFLAERDGLGAPGRIVDAEHGDLGDHDGFARYTIGQRRGLGVATGERRYVTDVDAATATVTIGRRDDLLRDEVHLTGLTFLRPRPDPTEALTVQTRAHGGTAPGRLGGTTITWPTPQPRVAPGQVVALYRGDEVVAGGWAV